MLYKPYLHQKKALRFIVDRDTSMLMSGSGMGDTVVALTVVQELLYERFVTDRVLIVTSRRSIRGRWINELEKWDHLKHIPVWWIRGSDAEHRHILKEGTGLFFITHESLAWLVDGEDFPFTHVIVDDFHLYRNPDTRRFKRFHRIRHRFTFLLALSAFVAMDHPEDLWGQMYLLDGGMRLEASKTGFYDRYYFSRRYNYNGYSRIVREPKEGALQKIRSKISDICFVDDPTLTIAETEIRRCNIYVQMEPAEYAKYRLLEKGVFVYEENTEDIACGGRTIRKMQAANGVICDQQKENHILHTHKVEEIRRIMQSAPNQRILVAYWFRHEREAFQNMLPQFVPLDTYEAVNKWRRREIRKAIVSAAQESAVYLKRIDTDVLIWFSLPWAVSAYERLNNSFVKKDGMTIYHLLSKNTVDEELIANIEKNRRECRILKGAGEDGGSFPNRGYPGTGKYS